MILFGIILGYFLGKIYIGHRKFARDRKFRQAEFDMLSDPEYNIEASRVDMGREIWLYNKFNICYAKILGQGWEYELQRNKWERDWEEMRERFIQDIGGEEKYKKLCEQLDVKT